MSTPPPPEPRVSKPPGTLYGKPHPRDKLGTVGGGFDRYFGLLTATFLTFTFLALAGVVLIGGDGEPYTWMRWVGVGLMVPFCAFVVVAILVAVVAMWWAAIADLRGR